MATVTELITKGLKMNGILAGDMSASTSDLNDGLTHLNGIIDEWNNDKLKSFAVEEKEHPLTVNVGEYSIGPTGDIFVASRPVKLEKVTVTDNYETTHDVELIQYDEYESIYLKTNGSSYPVLAYYNPDFENGVIKLYPLPQGNLTMKLLYWKPFPKFISLSQTISFPPGYEDLLCWKYAYEVNTYFGRSAPRTIEKGYFARNNKVNNTTAIHWVPTLNIETTAREGNNIIRNRTYLPRY
jgi:hypothetical protein